MKVKVLKRTANQVIEKVFTVDEWFYPELDFYEIVADCLGWKGGEDALWWLSRNNYIKVERVKDEVDNL